MRRATASAGVSVMGCVLAVSPAPAQSPLDLEDRPRLTLTSVGIEPRLSFAREADEVVFEAPLLSFAQPEGEEPPDGLGAGAEGAREGRGLGGRGEESVEDGEGAEEGERIPFGRAGSQWLTFGAGLAHNFRQDTGYNAHVSWSKFLADEVEFVIEAGGWYFHQGGDDTAGLNGNLVFRWHLLHPEETPPEEAWDWTVYIDLGIGLLGSFDNVPATGTGFAFTPRAGGGFTKQIADDGTRLQVGLRWHHISNGRIEGDVRNPSRDSIMVYAGIMIPF